MQGDPDDARHLGSADLRARSVEEILARHARQQPPSTTPGPVPADPGRASPPSRAAGRRTDGGFRSGTTSRRPAAIHGTGRAGAVPPRRRQRSRCPRGATRRSARTTDSPRSRRPCRRLDRALRVTAARRRFRGTQPRPRQCPGSPGRSSPRPPAPAGFPGPGRRRPGPLFRRPDEQARQQVAGRGRPRQLPPTGERFGPARGAPRGTRDRPPATLCRPAGAEPHALHPDP